MVNATETTSVTVNANKLRYSLTYDVLGTMRRGALELQRADKRADGTWMDDPTPGSRRSVPMPAGVDMGPLLALLPAIMGVDITGDVRLQLRGSLSPAGVLDVMIVVQFLAPAGWEVRTIPSLNAWLPGHMQHAQAIGDVWATMDTRIDTANLAEGWL